MRCYPKSFSARYLPILLLTFGCGGANTPSGAAAPAAAELVSWNESASKRALVDFVARVTRDGGEDFVPPGQRIAVFDNDGTLWTEQPMYVQVAFMADRVKALAPRHPEFS